MNGDGRWQDLRRVIEDAERFLLTTHVFPEGDAIGSEVALALHLRSLGKQVLVLNESAPLERYRFLTRHHPVLSWTEDPEWPDPAWPEVAICLDVSSWDYLGAVGRWIRASRARVVSIDHHHSPAAFGDLDLILEDAVATGEVLYRYFREVRAPITRPIAESLYTSILFDTWGLRLPGAANGTVALAAEILRHGVDHREICRHLFEADSYPKLDLLRLALGTLRSACEGRLAWLVIPEDLFLATGAEFCDSDGVLDHLLSLREVEICAMFRQQGRKGVKVTFRSKGKHDVGRLAEELGGGGRSSAAGVLLPYSLGEAMDSVLPRVHALLGVAPRAAVEPPAPARLATPR
jgi:phosphoesterase RecJ-like protein